MYPYMFRGGFLGSAQLIEQGRPTEPSEFVEECLLRLRFRAQTSIIILCYLAVLAFVPSSVNAQDDAVDSSSAGSKTNENKDIPSGKVGSDFPSTIVDAPRWYSELQTNPQRWRLLKVSGFYSRPYTAEAGTSSDGDQPTPGVNMATTPSGVWIMIPDSSQKQPFPPVPKEAHVLTLRDPTTTGVGNIADLLKRLDRTAIQDPKSQDPSTNPLRIGDGNATSPVFLLAENPDRETAIKNVWEVINTIDPALDRAKIKEQANDKDEYVVAIAILKSRIKTLIIRAQTASQAGGKGNGK